MGNMIFHKNGETYHIINRFGVSLEKSILKEIESFIDFTDTIQKRKKHFKKNEEKINFDGIIMEPRILHINYNFTEKTIEIEP